jgi:hypothetical protein
VAPLTVVLKTNICTPPIDCSYSAHPEVRALGSVASEDSVKTKQQKVKKQTGRLSRPLRGRKYSASTPSSDVQSPDTSFDGDLDTTSESPSKEKNAPEIPYDSQLTDHSSSFREYSFYESQEISETDLIKFISSDHEFVVNNKFLASRSESNSAVGAGSSPDLADCEDLGLDWDTPPGSFESLSPLFEGEEDLNFGFSDPIW